MTLQTSSSLSSVKEQVERMIETIHNLDSGEKNEAFGYIRKCLDDDKSNTLSKIVKNLPGKPITSTSDNNYSEGRPKRKIRKKIKFKNHTSTTVKRAVLKCRICGIPNKTKSSLLKHLGTHIGTPISCKLCRRDFNNRASFLCHISLKMCNKNRLKVKKYHCTQCPKVFGYKRHFDKHVEGHKRNNCTYCDARITRRKELEDHLLSVHGIKLERTVMFNCEFCQKRYVKKRSLYHHMKQHAEDKIVCMECGWLSDTPEENELHIKDHERNRPWKCNKCNDRFLRRQQYVHHMKRHDRYKCVTCNETFALKSRVLRHRQRGHMVQGLEPQNKCPHCTMAFQRRLNLQIHMRKHTDEKLMTCKYCDKNFRSPYLYFRHVASTVHGINSPETKQLVCENCGKSFMKKHHLDQHLHRVHNQAKQTYTCEFCGLKSSNRANMDRHLSLHLEDKKEVICEHCGQAFYNQSSLKDHISYVHSQERVLKCSQCDKAFKRNSELIRHMTSHSELRPYVCETCGVSYKRRTHLRRHEEAQHGTVLKNRRVQRLTKGENGELIPIPQEKKRKTNKKKSEPAANNQQLFSIMDTQSGEMVTFSLPETIENPDSLAILNINSQQFNQDAELPNLVLNPTNNIILTNDQSLNMVNTLEPSFTNNFLSNELTNAQINNSFLPTHFLAQPVTIQNSTTCDILLPENRMVNIQSQSDYSQNPYQFL